MTDITNITTRHMNLRTIYKEYCQQHNIQFNNITTVNPYDDSTLFCPAHELLRQQCITYIKSAKIIGIKIKGPQFWLTEYGMTNLDL